MRTVLPCSRARGRDAVLVERRPLTLGIVADNPIRHVRPGLVRMRRGNPLRTISWARVDGCPLKHSLNVTIAIPEARPGAGRAEMPPDTAIVGPWLARWSPHLLWRSADCLSGDASRRSSSVSRCTDYTLTPCDQGRQQSGRPLERFETDRMLSEQVMYRGVR
jgi:hypothetical protein